MIDFGFDKLALIGAVALIVIGPEKLPKVARTVGHLFGKAQRYVAEVKAEVARDVQTSVETTVRETGQAFETDWKAATAGLDGSAAPAYEPLAPPPASYKHPKKNWRLKRGAMPQWYKQRHGVRSKAQSGAARVARYRPPGLRG
jgi:sec-independent protein translocase protein TatB